MGYELDSKMAAAHERLGQSVPADTPHAVSVSLPTWRANVGYEEGEEWVTSKMQLGYPRFFIHPLIQTLADAVVHKYGMPHEAALLVSLARGARRCQSFMENYVPATEKTTIRVLDFVKAVPIADGPCTYIQRFSAVLFPKFMFKHAKTFWQHTGEGISSRRGEYCGQEFDQGLIAERSHAEDMLRQTKGPKRYRKAGGSLDDLTKTVSVNGTNVPNGGRDMDDRARFLEERFGRNLNMDQADQAKLAVRRRIAGSLIADAELNEALSQETDTHHLRDVAGFSDDDVYLHGSGMHAIFNTHRKILKARGPLKSICFGFPYIDTLKVLEKFGPGCVFYGFGTKEDLDDLERRLHAGERFLALFCEVPSNPLLRTPDLVRIRALADQFDFAVVIDETIGNYLNVHVLPYADVLVSSLTKIFSGDSNVMGGSAILNPKSQYYNLFKQTWTVEYEDNIWPEDAIFLERNSRDFVSRIKRINGNAEALCSKLQSHPRVKAVYYPKTVPSRKFYDQYRTTNGGYGGLLSATFHNTAEAAAFFDNLDTEKGPSLGTNFTLVCPFVLLAHYTELDWAAKYGAEKNLIRFSVGLENVDSLLSKVDIALAATEKVTYSIA